MKKIIALLQVFALLALCGLSGPAAADPAPGDPSYAPGPADVSNGPGPGDVSYGPGPGDVSYGPGPGDVSYGPGPGDVSYGPGPGDASYGPGPGDASFGPGPGDASFGPGPGDASYGPGPGDASYGPGPGDASFGPGPGDASFGPGPGDASFGPGPGDTSFGPGPGGPAEDIIPDAEESLEKLFSTAYYASMEDTVIAKDGYRVELSFGDRYALLVLDGKSVTSAEVKLVSGNPDLEERVYTYQDDMVSEEIIFVIGSSAFRYEGESVFHVKLESPGRNLEKDYTLRVLPFTDSTFAYKSNRMEVQPFGRLSVRDVLAGIGDTDQNLEESLPEVYSFTVTDSSGMEHRLDPSDIQAYMDGLVSRTGASRETAALLDAFRESVTLTGEWSVEIRNVRIIVPEMTFKLFPYIIQGPGEVYPGCTAEYRFVSLREKDMPAPEDIVLTAEGAELDSAGNLILSPDAQPGDRILITAVSPSENIHCEKTVLVTEKPVRSLQWAETEAEGITVPYPVGDGTGDPVLSVTDEGGSVRTSLQLGGKARINCQYRVSPVMESQVKQSAEEKTAAIVADWTRNQGLSHVTAVTINGYPLVYGVREEKTPAYENTVLILSAQIGDRNLELSYDFSTNTEFRFSLPWEEFLAEVFSRIRIDGEPADIQPAAQ